MNPLSSYGGIQPTDPLQNVEQLVDEEPGAIGKFLNALDYPGASVRGVLAGKPYGGDVTRYEGRVSGRDVLTNLIGAPQNKETGFSFGQIVKDPVETAWDLAGFATEVITDPLSYIGLGRLSQSGRAAKASRTLPKGFFKQMVTKADDGTAFRNAVSFSNPLKLNPFADTNIPVEGLNPIVARVGEQIADNANRAFEAMPGSKHIVEAGKFIRRKSGVPGDKTLRQIEKAGRLEKIDAADAALGRPLTAMHWLFDKYGDEATNKALQIRALRETPSLLNDPEFMREVAPVLDELTTFYDESLSSLKEVGALKGGAVDVSPMFDPKIWRKFAAENNIDFTPGYVPRMESFLAGKYDDTFGRIHLPNDAARPGRFEHYRTDTFGRGFLHGTKTINELFTDPDVHGEIARLRGAKALDPDVDDIGQLANFLDKKYGKDGLGTVLSDIQDRNADGLLFRNLATGSELAITDNAVKDMITAELKNGGISQAVEGYVPMFQGKDLVLEPAQKGAVKASIKASDLVEKLGRDDAIDAMTQSTVFDLDGVKYTVAKKGTDKVMMLPSIKWDKKSGDWVTDILAPQMRDDTRFQNLAKAMVDERNVEALQQGVFPNDLMQDTLEYAMASSNRVATLMTGYRAIGSAMTQSVTDPDNAKSLRSVMEQAFGGTVDHTQAKRKIYQAMQAAKGKSISDDTVRAIDKKMIDELVPDSTLIDGDLAKDISLVVPGAMQDGGNLVMNGLRQYSNLWKASVLTWPARYVRDMTSALVRNVEAGFVTNPQDAVRTLIDAHNIYVGKGVERLRNLKPIQAELARIGVDVASATPEQLSRAFKVNFARYNGMGMTVRQELGGVEQILEKGLDEILPGTAKPLRSLGGSILDARKQSASSVDRFKNRYRGNRLITAGESPRDLPGAAGKVFRMGDAVGNYTDQVTRMQAYLAQLERGIDPSVAMANLQEALLNYDPRRLSPFERNTMKTIFPFYTFFRWNVPWVAGQLLQRPGGRVAQLMRVYRSPEVESDIYAPEWIKDSFAVPYKSGDEKLKMYVNGFGLMTEDAIDTLSGVHTLFSDPKMGVRKILGEGVQRTHPLLKGAGEYALGVSSFQTTDDGGVQLKNLDPPLGRAISNVAAMFGKDVNARNLFPQQDLIEPGLMALPFYGRAISAVKTITDSRDTPWSTRGLNMLTGTKITTQNQTQQLGNAQEVVDKLQRQFGNVFYEVNRLVVDKEELEKLPPEKQELIKEYNSARRTLGELKKISREKEMERKLNKAKASI